MVDITIYIEGVQSNTKQFVAILLAGAVHSVVAQNATTSEPLLYHATMQSIGVTAPFAGDDNGDNTATIRYRMQGSTEWLAGHLMTEDRAAGVREYRVSLVYLEPDTNYEIEVIYQDPDGVSPAVVSSLIRTRSNYPYRVEMPGVIRIVPDDGDLQTVMDAANSGDTIQIREGVYYEQTLFLQSSGQPNNYISIEPFPGDTVIFDGSNTENSWSFYTDTLQGAVYYTDIEWGNTSCSSIQPAYVGEGDGWRYQLFTPAFGWTNFLAEPPGKAFYDCDGTGPEAKEKRLYVITYGGDDPNNHILHVAKEKRGFHLKAVDYIRIRGFEFRYYGGSGIHVNSGSDAVIIENNIFHGTGEQHIRVDGSNDTLIQNNVFYENGYKDSGWIWDVYYHEGHAGHVSIRLADADQGTVIRNNQFTMGHDAINANKRSNNVDIHDNIISNYMDNAIEVDYNPGQNIRLWNNQMSHTYAVVSYQDWNEKNHGPVYFFRNVIVGGEDPEGRKDYTGGVRGYDTASAFKLGSDSDPESEAYFYHNTISVVFDEKAKGNGYVNSGGAYFGNAVSRNNILICTYSPIFLGSQAIHHHDFDYDNLPDFDYDPKNPQNGRRFVVWGNRGGPEDNGLYRTMADFQTSTGQERHGLSDTNTVFGSDWRLRSGSPEIDAGTLITGFNDRGPNHYFGLAPDIGAHEFSGDDEPGFTMMPSRLRLAENGGTGTFSIVLNQAPDSGVVLNVNSDSSQVSLDSSVLTFSPSNWFVWQTVTVTSVDDADDGNESTILTIAVDDNFSDDSYDVVPDQKVEVLLWDDELKLSMWLKLDETKESTIAVDSSLSGNEGIIFNNPTLDLPGKWGSAYAFDKADDYILINDFDYGPAFTLSFWFKLTDYPSGTQYLFAQEYSGNTNSLGVAVAPSSDQSKIRLLTHLRDHNDQQDSSALKIYDVSEDVWHLYTLVVDSAGPNSRVYVDAVEESASELGGEAFNPPKNIYIGDREDFSYNFNSGLLDDIRIYNRALSANEVQSLYVTPPAKPTLIAPQGEINGSTPTYTWQALDNAEAYLLQVYDSEASTAHVLKWYSAAEAGCVNGFCSITPNMPLNPGNVVWWVKASNKAGTGALSDPMFFVVIEEQPDQVILVSPSGSMTERTSTFKWHVANGATWYYLWINDPAGQRFTKWYSSKEAGCVEDCQVNISDDLLKKEVEYTWWVLSWNSAGNGLWSESQTFILPGTPSVIEAISPVGKIENRSTPFVWRNVPSATWYYLWINKESTEYYKKWYTANEAACSVQTDSCQVTLPTLLKNGKYRWWVQTWNEAGYGPWNKAVDFQLGGLPSKITLSAPSGPIGTRNPDYVWEAVNATWYQVWVNQGASNLFQKWYTATESGCGEQSGSCHVKLSSLTNGKEYTWWVRGWNSFGYGSWSDAMVFDVGE